MEQRSPVKIGRSIYSFSSTPFFKKFVMLTKGGPLKVLSNSIQIQT